MGFWDEIESLFDGQKSSDDIDWQNPLCKITNHFIVEEALFLHKWGRLANEDDGLTDGIKQNLVSVFTKMEIVRAFIDAPMRVSSCYRPSRYNWLFGGTAHSAHICGMAVDWYVKGVNCNRLRAKIVPMLAMWEMRCENECGNWIHLDIRNFGRNRYFKP